MYQLAVSWQEPNTSILTGEAVALLAAHGPTRPQDLAARLLHLLGDRWVTSQGQRLDQPAPSPTCTVSSSPARRRLEQREPAMPGSPTVDGRGAHPWAEGHGPTVTAARSRR